jgi:hypothetical protein
MAKPNLLTHSSFPSLTQPIPCYFIVKVELRLGQFLKIFTANSIQNSQRVRVEDVVELIDLSQPNLT